MNIHEYQAKELLQSFGVPTPKGVAGTDTKTVVRGLDDLAGPVYVVKSQIHAGGRGAGHFKDDVGGKGGVRVVSSRGEAVSAIEAMMGKVLVTKQTGAEGRVVRRVYVEEASDIDREFYLAILLDRVTSRLIIMASAEGGMSIEDLARDTPEKIIYVSIDPAVGYQAFHGRKVGFSLGLSGRQIKQCVPLLGALVKAYQSLDAALIEINPFVVTKGGELLALDAKINFDTNALYRQGDVEALRDSDEEEPAEREAAQLDLNYIRLDGNIGCMVNGAGLAMATMDIIQLKGGRPANFLDVGGGATKERVSEAMRIILSDPDVDAILINIFGGIMRCDIIAEGTVAAVNKLGVKVPLVVRLEGTNVEQGKKILNDSGLKIITADNLEEAAERAVQSLH